MISTSQPGLPRYAEIAEKFRHQIRTGQLTPGDRLPSFAQMHAQYGFGQGTMERIHALLRDEGLIEHQRGRGTFVAQPRSRPATGLIGLSGLGFTTSVFSPYWAHLMEGVHDAMKRAEMQILLLDDASPAGWDKVDGVLMCDWCPERTLRWVPAGLPCVSLLNPVAGVPSVLTDDYEGVRTATRHLLGLGHRRIGYLTTMHAHRLGGYRDALGAAGIKRRAGWTRRIGSPAQRVNFTDTGYHAMKQWLADGWAVLGCTALLVHNDEAAIGAISALREAGYRVPEDISVVGFDGVEAYDYFSPRLSTVEVPLRQIGVKAMELLLRRHNSEVGEIAADESAAAETVVVASTFRIGASTAPVT